MIPLLYTVSLLEYLLKNSLNGVDTANMLPLESTKAGISFPLKNSINKFAQSCS